MKFEYGPLNPNLTLASRYEKILVGILFVVSTLKLAIQLASLIHLSNCNWNLLVQMYFKVGNIIIKTNYKILLNLRKGELFITHHVLYIEISLFTSTAPRPIQSVSRDVRPYVCVFRVNYMYRYIFIITVILATLIRYTTSYNFKNFTVPLFSTQPMIFFYISGACLSSMGLSFIFRNKTKMLPQRTEETIK